MSIILSIANRSKIRVLHPKTIGKIYLEPNYANLVIKIIKSYTNCGIIAVVMSIIGQGLVASITLCIQAIVPTMHNFNIHVAILQLMIKIIKKDGFKFCMPFYSSIL